MTAATRRPIMIWVSIMVLLGQVGCGPLMARQPPLSPELLVGTIGVEPTLFLQELEYQAPARGRMAGAGRGAIMGFESFSGGGVAGVLAPYAGVVGAMGGAVRASPAAMVEKAEAALKSALADHKIQEALHEQILQVARDRSHPFVMVNKSDSYWSQGIDIILESRVLRIGLVGSGGIKPPLDMVMTVRVRLIRVTDFTEISVHTWEYWSSTPGHPTHIIEKPTYVFTGANKFHTLVNWAAHDAQLFRQELERAYRVLAKQIIMYVTGEPIL